MEDAEIQDVCKTKSLTTDIEADILKGIRLNLVLKGFGNSFKSNVGHQVEFLQAVTRECLNDFISHDWSSGRWRKTIALCIIYNGRAAMVISTLVALLLLVLQNKSLLGVLPFWRPYDHDVVEENQWWPYLEMGMWAQLLCPLVFLFVFFFWQHMRDIIGLDVKYVFVDKFCIDQLDREKKAKGILGLGGFLSKTERLVICWTPRYFTRLWCTYEIASWLYLRKPMDSVLFFPLAIGFTAAVLGCIMEIAALTNHFLSCTSLGSFYFLFQLIVFLVIAPGAMHFFRRLVNDLHKLPQQIEQFSIQDAGCFCCTVNHIMPGTGERLPCDREVVYKTLENWFPTDERTDIQFGATLSRMSELDQFDKEVRELFGAFILRSSGPTRFAYKHILVGVMPYWWRTFDAWVGLGSEHSKYVFITAMSNSITAFALAPSALKICFYMLVFLDRLFGIPQNKFLDLLVSLMSGLIGVIIFFCLWVVLYASQDMEIAYVFVCILFVLLTGMLYPESYSRLRSPGNGECKQPSPPQKDKPGEGNTPATIGKQYIRDDENQVELNDKSALDLPLVEEKCLTFFV